MTIQTKTKRISLFAACLFAVFVFAGCNNAEKETESTGDAPKTETKTDAPPATTTDSTTMDAGDTRPVPSPN